MQIGAVKKVYRDLKNMPRLRWRSDDEIFLSFFLFFYSFFFFLSKVLSASSEDEVEVLVKLMQHNEDMAAGVLLDQQTILITDDESEAVFNFAAIATNADKLTIEVSKRSFLISPETKTTTRLCF